MPRASPFLLHLSPCKSHCNPPITNSFHSCHRHVWFRYWRPKGLSPSSSACPCFTCFMVSSSSMLKISNKSPRLTFDSIQTNYMGMFHYLPSSYWGTIYGNLHIHPPSPSRWAPTGSCSSTAAPWGPPRRPPCPRGAANARATCAPGDAEGPWATSNRTK